MVRATSGVGAKGEGHVARGRGAGFNPLNRFERIAYEPDEQQDATDDLLEPDQKANKVKTVLLRDASKSILAKNDSPDLNFDYSINPYRGCEHGCAYCYARPTHEFLGFSAGLDFETRILVKEDAPWLLREQFLKPRWEPSVVALSGNTDAYQPIERKLQITRRCLEVFLEFRNPVQIITKNAMVQRDLDLLGELATHQAAGVTVSVTTLDSSLVGKLEPRTSSPRRRLETIRALRSAGVRTTVLIAPIIPGLNDHEIPAICEAIADAGAQQASYVMLRLPLTVAPLFEDWLERHYPDRRAKILHKLQGMRSGRLNDPRFGSRMRGQGPEAQHIADLFALSKRKFGLDREIESLSTANFRRPFQQLPLL